MAYTTGTAANYQDLLAVMASFAAANGHAVLEQSATRVYMMGTGLAGLDEIYYGVETYADAPNNRYNWQLAGSWGWVSKRALDKHPKSSCYDRPNGSASPVAACFWNAPIPYWMVANPRRIIVVGKVGTTYQMAHFGLLTVPGTDAQYPYPLLIGGCGDSLTRNYSDTGNMEFWGTSGLGKHARLCYPGGQWGTLNGVPSVGDLVPPFKIITFNDINKTAMLTAFDGSYLLEPLYCVADAAVGVLGQIEGLFRVTGYNNTAENIITVGGVNSMVFPDGSRSGYGDYCALRLN